MNMAQTQALRARTLTGLLPETDPLSIRQALANAHPGVSSLCRYDQESLWELDTRSLPKPLAQWRRQARDFAEERLRPLAREMDQARPAGTPMPAELRALLTDAGRAGWLTDLLPRPFGTLPLTSTPWPLTWMQCLKVEEFASACGGLMLLLCAHGLGMAPIVLSGDVNAIRRFVLPAYRQNRRGQPHLFAYAITEPGGGSDAEEGHGARQYRPGVVARKVAGGWRLNGRKCFISGGDIADTLSVFAALEGEGMESWTCFVVRSDMSGFSPVRNELKMGMKASSATELEFDDVFVPNHHVVGGLRRGWTLNRVTLNYSRLPVGAMGLGFARRALEETIRQSHELRTGNQRLLDQQPVQMGIARIMASLRSARGLVWQGAQRFAPRQSEAAMAKFHASDVAVSACEQAMELLGPHALSGEGVIGKCFRDARLTQIFEGTNQINQLGVVEDLQSILTDPGQSPLF